MESGPLRRMLGVPGIGNVGLLGTWGVVEGGRKEDKNDRGIVESTRGKGLSYNSKSDSNLMNTIT